LNDGGWVEPKVLLRGRIYGIFKNLFKISFSGRKIIWMGEFFAGKSRRRDSRRNRAARFIHKAIFDSEI
jgi:hypothetical protein